MLEYVQYSMYLSWSIYMQCYCFLFLFYFVLFYFCFVFLVNVLAVDNVKTVDDFFFIEKKQEKKITERKQNFNIPETLLSGDSAYAFRLLIAFACEMGLWRQPWQLHRLMEKTLCACHANSALWKGTKCDWSCPESTNSSLSCVSREEVD